MEDGESSSLTIGLQSCYLLTDLSKPMTTDTQGIVKKGLEISCKVFFYLKLSNSPAQLRPRFSDIITIFISARSVPLRKPGEKHWISLSSLGRTQNGQGWVNDLRCGRPQSTPDWLLNAEGSGADPRQGLHLLCSKCAESIVSTQLFSGWREGSSLTTSLERERAQIITKRFIPSVDSLRMLYLRASGVNVLLLSSTPLPCRRKTKKGCFGFGAVPFFGDYDSSS